MQSSRVWKALAGAAACAVIATGCSGGGDDKATAPKTKVDGSVEVTPGPVNVASARLDPPVVLEDAVRDQMLDTVKHYVQVATVDPLRTGRGATAIAPLFTAAAASRARGPDRAVLVDEGLPRATAHITAKAVPVAITVLADQTGNLVLATAGLELTVDTKTAKGPVAIRRVGQLTLAPDAGTWKVAGFDLFVKRTGKGVDAAARASNTATTTTKGGS